MILENGDFFFFIIIIRDFYLFIIFRQTYPFQYAIDYRISFIKWSRINGKKNDFK